VAARPSWARRQVALAARQNSRPPLTSEWPSLLAPGERRDEQRDELQDEGFNCHPADWGWFKSLLSRAT